MMLCCTVFHSKSCVKLYCVMDNKCLHTTCFFFTTPTYALVYTPKRTLSHGFRIFASEQNKLCWDLAWIFNWISGMQIHTLLLICGVLWKSNYNHFNCVFCGFFAIHFRLLPLLKRDDRNAFKFQTNYVSIHEYCLRMVCFTFGTLARTEFHTETLQHQIHRPISPHFYFFLCACVFFAFENQGLSLLLKWKFSRLGCVHFLND